jgi:hypothetical protein
LTASSRESNVLPVSNTPDHKDSGDKQKEINKMATTSAATGQNTGGRAHSDNGQANKTVLGDIEFGKVVKGTRPATAGGLGKGRKANPMDPATLGNLNEMLNAGGTTEYSVNWKGTNFAFRQQVQGTFDKWSKAQELIGVIVKFHRNTLAQSPNKLSPAADDNDKEVFVNYYISVEPKVPVKA